MKRFFLLFAIVTVAASCSSIEKREAPVRQGYDDALYGDVESVIVEEFQCNGRPLEGTTLKPSRTEQYTFNEAGDLKELKYNDVYEGVRVLKNADYNAEGRLVQLQTYIGNALSWRLSYKYDDEGRVLEEIYYSAEENSTSKIVYTYNDEGNMVESKIYENDELSSTKHYTYDAKSQEIEFVMLNADGTMKIKEFTTYDKRGNVVERSYHNANSTLDNRTVYEYDKRGNLVRATVYDEQGAVDGYVVKTYDESDNLTEHAEYRADGKLDFRVVMNYDAQGNQIERVHYRGREQDPQTVVRTTIKYRIVVTPEAEE
jgi:YD repeat-containing protein